MCSPDQNPMTVDGFSIGSDQITLVQDENQGTSHHMSEIWTCKGLLAGSSLLDQTENTAEVNQLDHILWDHKVFASRALNLFCCPQANFYVWFYMMTFFN